MKKTLKAKRVTGGTGWADAIFRGQADSGSYANEIIKRVIRKSNLESEGFKTYLSETEIVLVKENEIILKMSFHMVEAFRCEGVFCFETYIESQIKNILNIANKCVF